ncbi:hypothetical protein EYF80_018088 [Liparis tanakae]|uniref:Uncharacterized protein n=1 Tax=Liparis tanakae TaxID=230148 RepID=A0A4Z2I195_9TELE|nr:hypothetical protein EYF80_018088 [Liparis tanakae]
MLRFDPRAGAHFGFATLVEGHKPVAAGPVVPVDHRGVRIVAVLLEAFPEPTVVREPILKEERTPKGPDA